MAAVPGPPNRKVDKSPQRLTEDILKCKTPTYYHVGRAWNLLGYYRSARPTVQDFADDVTALWDHQATLKTPRGRKARAYILDALRTLGFRNPHFHTERNSLRLEVGDQDGSWLNLPDPPRGGNNFGKKDARQYLAAVAPRATRNEPDHKGMIERQTLVPDFHLFYGFRYGHGQNPDDFDFNALPVPAGANGDNLRALPVPEGANSLWHCLSYLLYRRHRLENGKPVGGGSLWHHWEVKARIWTYFMQVLKNPRHELWAEYHILQYKSTVVDPNFGTLSIARSLYAAPSQGKPAYPHEYLLHVIADYFGTKVQVYTSEADERHRDQYDLPVQTTFYGLRPHTSDYPTLTLALNKSGTQYSIVQSDDLPLHQTPGFSAAHPFPANLPADEHYQRDHEGGTPPRFPRPANLVIPDPEPREVRPPCEQARYNYFAEADRAALNSVANPQGEIVPETAVPHTAWYPAEDGADHHVVGVLPWRLQPQAAWADVLLTTEVWARFRAGVDIPGFGFVVPGEGIMEGWWERAGADVAGLDGLDVEMPGFVHAPREWQWRFGEDPMVLEGRPLPGEDDKEGARHMVDYPDVEFERDMWRGVLRG